MIFSSFMYIDHFLSGVTTFFLLYCIFLTSAYNLVFLGGCKNYWDCSLAVVFSKRSIYQFVQYLPGFCCNGVCVLCGVLSHTVRLCLVSLIHYSSCAINFTRRNGIYMSKYEHKLRFVFLEYPDVMRISAHLSN